jgi:hypothetical protein
MEVPARSAGGEERGGAKFGELPVVTQHKPASRRASVVVLPAINRQAAPSCTLRNGVCVFCIRVRLHPRSRCCSLTPPPQPLPLPLQAVPP